MRLQNQVVTWSIALSLLSGCSGNVAEPGIEDEELKQQELVVETPLVRAYLGGRDVALVWNEIPNATYTVYRNGQVIQKAPGAPTSGKPNTFIDQNVVPGGVYAYQVRANVSGSYSPWGNATVVTYSDAGISTPNIDFDLSLMDPNTPGLATMMADGKNFLESWYPKIVKLIAAPVYQPDMHLTLKLHPGQSGGWVDKGLPIVNIGAASAQDMGLYVHEATHVIQVAHGRTLASAEESIASWAGNISIGKPNAVWTQSMSFFDDYQYGAYFYDWIAKTYNKPSFVRDLNLAAYRGEYNNGAWLVQYTGLTLGQLWGNMFGKPFTSPGSLKNADGYYAYPQDSNLRAWTRLYLTKRPPDYTDRFFQGPLESGKGWLRWEKTTCFGENSDHYVIIQPCSSAPRWIYENGAYKNTDTNPVRCLQAENKVSAESVQLVTAPCDGSTAQRWDALPL